MQARLGHLLIVEDSDEDFDTMLEATRIAGVTNEIRRETSGEECLHHLEELIRLNHPLPRLVMLDLNTPKGDGREALRSIVLNARLRSLPLVVLSASSNTRDVSFCYDHGANAYHIKPVSHPAHLQILKNIFAYWLNCAELPCYEGSERV